MANRFLKDSELQLPDLTVVSASAGAGKTQSLAMRYLQLLLSPRIKHNALPNILAITFTKNAAKEMRQRILELLKKTALADDRTLKEVQSYLDVDSKELIGRSTEILKLIFDRYSSVQIQTIDSFIARLFKAASFELGYDPAYEIILNVDAQLEQAFKDLSLEGMNKPEIVNILDALQFKLGSVTKGKDRMLWNPFLEIFQQVRSIYRTTLTYSKDLRNEDTSKKIEDLQAKVLREYLRLERNIHDLGLEPQQRLLAQIELAKANDLEKLCSLKPVLPPVKKPKKGGNVSSIAALTDIVMEIENLLSIYVELRAEQYFNPAVQAIDLLTVQLENLKTINRQIPIDDVQRLLTTVLQQGETPEIYFRLGDTIHHYLVDEFQDTAPIQHRILTPLFEEPLAGYGSCYIVGDTKQSIYRFRGADWRLMKKYEAENPYPSAHHNLIHLPKNFRSDEAIVELNRTLFETIIPAGEYADAASKSGLTTECHQEVDFKHKGKGVVEINYFDPENERDCKERLCAILHDIYQRSKSYRNIAILTGRNDDVEEVSGWLSEAAIPFVSYSSLDIRKRKIILELLSLLRFLDSPIDNLSFGAVIVGEMFANGQRIVPPETCIETMRHFLEEHTEKRVPIYKSFESAFPEEWHRLFERLFQSVGYLPLYDLVCEILKTFRVFHHFPHEEAALASLMEVVHQYESNVGNSLRSFLKDSITVGADDGWQVSDPSGSDAVKIMTVHKAKGLGFDIVIALINKFKTKAGNNFVEIADDGIRLLRIRKSDTERSDRLKNVYGKEGENIAVDALNALYVALTRAKEELYILAENDPESFPTKALQELNIVSYPKAEQAEIAVPKSDQVALFHSEEKTESAFKTSFAISTYEQHRGEAIHSVLSSIDYLEDISQEKLLEVCLARLPKSIDIDANAVAESLMTLISRETLKKFFVRREGRTILREHALVDNAGNLFRPDRIVIDSDSVTIIEYKTGTTSKTSEHIDQVQRYKSILGEIFPEKHLRGLLLYIDSATVEEVL
jgi:ATP-dependent exoDNAse (exonuclease V) beta subunit